nr:uncharacterized mitochondrial protein AtMg00810-like [Tanacetum cinerariifolium]
MTGNLKLQTNFVEKFLGTVKFGNDQIAPILGYGDLVQGAVTIKRVYYVEGLNHSLFFVSQFCDADLEVAFQKSKCYIRDLKGNDLSQNDIVIGLPKLKFIKDHLCSSLRIVRTDKGTEFLNKTLHPYFAYEGINHQTSVARTPEQNGVVERRNRTLVEAARTMLSAAKVPLDGENLDKMKEKGDACIFVGYSTQSRAYKVFNKRTSVIVETIHVNFDELPQMASDHVKSDPVPQCQRTELKHDSLSLGPQCQENVPHVAGTVTTSNELDLLFSLMFDELINGSAQVMSKYSAVTTADAPNTCQQQYTIPLNIQSTPDPTCQVLTQAPTVTSTENINQAETIAENAQVKDDEFINIFCTPVQDRGETSSRHVDSLNMHTFYQRHPSEHYWTKDHPPDIVHATCYYARYQAQSTEKHLTAVKRIFWYLKDTITMGLWYPKDTGFELTAFSDSDHAGCLDSRKSTSGGIQFLGGDKLFSWSSKKQDCTSMSSAKAEYAQEILISMATPTQAWLWHRRLSRLNFNYINLLSKKAIVIGLPKLKYVKDQLCSSCELSKAKRSSFKSKVVPCSKGRLNLLHMDLCGPMRVASINGKKYILVIVDDYSRYTWTLFL